MTTETKIYRGRTLEDLLPKIRAEIGEDAVITHQREGLVGGIGGFFAKRCVEVEVRAGESATAPARSALPARRIFDAYDASPIAATVEELRNPVIDAMIAQAAPFAEAAPFTQALDAAEQRDPDRRFESFEPLTAIESTTDGDDLTPPDPLPDSDADFAPVRARAIELGLPEPVADALVREAERGMRPFDQDATTEQLVRRAFARQVRIEHGWKTKRRTVALVGPAGCGKTLAVAKLCHAYAAGSRTAVRTLSLEPATSAYRLGTLTEHLDIGLRIAETPEAAERAAVRMQGESLIVIDTPPVSARDAEGISALAQLLAAVKPDEIHLVVPATMDARAARALYEALMPEIAVNRLLISRLDEADSAAVAAGLSFTLKRPISYLSEGRRPNGGLRPADAAELAELVLP
jgi:flagellar biosynthesis GTPase FlhF